MTDSRVIPIVFGFVCHRLQPQRILGLSSPQQQSWELPAASGILLMVISGPGPSCPPWGSPGLSLDSFDTPMLAGFPPEQTPRQGLGGKQLVWQVTQEVELGVGK